MDTTHAAIEPANDSEIASAETETIFTTDKPAEARILDSLRSIAHALELHSRQLAARFDITSTQLACLLDIARTGSLTATALARHVHLSPSTLVGVLDRLEKKGLVRRERDLRDRRLVYVSVTERGAEVTRNLPSPLPDRLTEALANLSELEAGTIALSLETVVNLMQKPA